MITVDPSATVPRLKNMVISFANTPKMIIPLAHDLARGNATRMSGREDDHV